MLEAAMILGTFSGCNFGSSNTPKTERQNVKPAIEATEIDFLKDGTSDYVIVQPEQATENEAFAAGELQHFIEAASGAKLEIVSESAEMAAGKYLFVGATRAADAAGVKPTYEEVKYNGFVIRVVDDDCYLRGYSDIGTRNAIYEFLYYAFDYECYAADEIALTPTESAKMLAYDLTVTPDFDWREVNYGELIYDTTLSSRMRFNATEDIFVLGHQTHCSQIIINPQTYDYKSEEYKDWFAQKTWGGVYGDQEVPVQLCYSNEEMRVEYTKNLIEMIKDSPAPNMLLGMEDNADWCTCEKCTASKEKYGTDSAVVIQFVNKVQADVDKWFAENRPDREPTRLVVFAYYSTINPPAKYDAESGEWKPIDDSVILNDHSSVMFAPIKAEYDIPFDATDISDVSSPYGQLLGWASLCKTMFAWTYSLLPQHGLIFCDTLEVTPQNYKLLKDNGTIMLLDQTDHYQRNANSGWSRLKAYVMSKMQWDTSLNMGELIDDFFAHYFAEAGDTMQELFTLEREWLSHVYADLGATGMIQENLLDAAYWPYNVLQSFMDKLDEAYADIAPLQEENPERYRVLYDRILLESMQFRYLILQLYTTEFSKTELIDARNEFRYDFERLGLTSYQEGSEITKLWTEWGIN